MLARSSPFTSKTIRPASIMMVRLPSSNAWCILWVTIRQVIFRSDTMLRVSSSTFSAVPGSSAAVCSSNSSSLGVTIVAMSKVSAWRWPPESSPTGWRIRFSKSMPSRDRCSRNSSLSFLFTRLKKAWCGVLARR